MSQVTPQNPPEEARDSLRRNVQKTVAVSTLRKIRGMVDDYDEEERRNHRLSRRVVATTVVLVAILAVILALSGGALPRVLTAVLGWFRG